MGRVIRPCGKDGEPEWILMVKMLRPFGRGCKPKWGSFGEDYLFGAELGTEVVLCNMFGVDGW